MTAPSYTEDLTDIDLAQSTTGWAESTVTLWKDGGAATTDTDYPYIQGTVAISQQATKNTYASLLYNNGSGITLPTDGAFFVWQVFSSPTALDLTANGGHMVLIGSGLGDFYGWFVGGSDSRRNPYGGWDNFAVNTTISADTTVGTPGTPEQYIGAAVNTVTGIGKGNPHAVDAIRYGRGSSIFEFGDSTNGYCTFAGYAASNDATSTRWGLIQAIDGGYLYKGKMTLGTGSNAVDFRDSDVNILIDDTPKCTANFNTIEINNASSRVDWDNIKFTALGTQSPGRLVTNANADLNWDACQFTDMGEFEFGGTTSVSTNTIWNGCGRINNTGVRADVSGSQVLASTVVADEGAFYWNVSTNPDTYTDGMAFSQGATAHHAFRFGTAVTGNITIRNADFSGFGAGADTNGSVFRFDATSGSLTLSLVGCSHDGSGFTVDDAAGITVTVSIDPVTVTVNVNDNNGVAVPDAYNTRVLLEAADSSGDFPFLDNVSITRSGATASVSHTAHGLDDNDTVVIRGADQQEYNGAFTITNTTTNAYDYTVSGSPTTPATGNRVANAQDETDYTASFSGGTGHATNDVLTLDKNILVTVDAVSGGVVTQFTVDSENQHQGNASGDTLAQRSTDGAGADFDITLATANMTISSSGAMLSDTTTTGAVSDSRTFTSNTPVKGFARKASASPRFKSAPIEGTIDTTAGLTINVQLILDE